jgi:hypothetical protein
LELRLHGRNELVLERFVHFVAMILATVYTYVITVLAWMQNCVSQLSYKRTALNIFQVQQSLNSTKNVDSGLQRYIKNITILLRQFISFPYMLSGIFAYLVFLWEMGG